MIYKELATFSFINVIILGLVLKNTGPFSISSAISE